MKNIIVNPLDTIRRFIKTKLPENNFLRGVIFVAAGSSFAQGLGIIFSPILTRLYTPDDFGILALYASFLAMALNFTSFRYEFAIPIANDNETAINLVNLCALLVLFFSIFSFLVIGFLFEKMQYIDQFKSLGQYIWFLPLGIFFAGIYQIFNYWAIRERMYSTISSTKARQGIASITTQLGLGILLSSPVGLIIGQIFGQSAGIQKLTWEYWKKNRCFLNLSIKKLKISAYRYKKFPIFQSSASLLNSTGLELPILLFSGFYGAEVAGHFYFSQKIFSIPISLIASSISNVYIGEISKLIQTPKLIKKMFKEINLKLCILSVIPCLILALSGKWFFQFIFGEQWIQSGVYVQVMACTFFFKFTTDSVINFAIIERQDLSISWALTRLVLVFLGIMFAIWFDLSEFWAVVFFSVAMTVSYILKYLMWNYAINKMVLSQFNYSSGQMT